MNNGRKEFPESGLEMECTSKKARKVFCYVQNVRGIKSFVKRSMNKRQRKYSKEIDVFDEL